MADEASGEPLDLFWRLIDQSERDPAKLEGLLMEMSANEIYGFQDTFLELAVELQDEPYSQYLDDDESEDGLEDVAHWVVSQGRRVYEDVLSTPSNMPPHIDADDPTDLSGVAYAVHQRKFGRPLEIA